MKDIKRRIKSVDSTRQITKAMELVASSKMRKAKERVEHSRPLFTISYETIQELLVRSRGVESDYLKNRGETRPCLIVIAGDRGLAGGYNSSLLKTAQALLDGAADPVVVPIGKKALEYFSRKKVEIVTRAYDSVESMSALEAEAIAELVCKLYREKKINSLHIVYTNFVSVLNQQPASLKLLPLVPRKPIEGGAVLICEPSPQAVLDRLIPQYLAGMIQGAVSESFASEQGARRTAMESANDNASQMIDSLHLQYNRARQAAITQEITEIAAGAQALQ